MIEELLKERILILDGAIGTMIQKLGLSEPDFRERRFAGTRVNLKGNNDILNLTCPDAVRDIHRAYVEAGADIITTNTFNSNAVSQADYECGELVYELNVAGAKIAKEAASKAERPVFVAGSMGPTSKTLSLSPDAERPEYRPVGFDALAATYADQVRGLLDGGADVLLVETVFDGLNAKAALYAIETVAEERGARVPVMVSATVNDRSGRTLTGQTIEALYVALSHHPLLSFGLNCSFGAAELRPFVERLSALLPCCLSLYPNAGLPNEMGEYDETPEFTARCLREMAGDGLLNIAGGCCGTTPAHIRAIREALSGIAPRKPKERTHQLVVSGLETVTVDRTVSNFVNIGERCNVAGSAKFAKLIRAHDYTAATDIARKQIEDGASVIDINMDDAMIDSAKEMETFLRTIANDPDIARAALMIDSSDWNTLLAGLKNAQGKCIVNSISLKEGETEFIRRAVEIRRLGAAVVVMAFDEKGQAVDYERKIAICQRAYKLLTEKAGFAPENIVFDVNILSVGTGMEEHANYAVDFIRAVAWIKSNLPGCRTSGGVSNLSFAFRGNNPVREAMHSVFLYHAIQAGLDMAIVNPGMLQVYDEIEPELLRAVEDVVLNQRPDATDRLIAFASRLKTEQAAEHTERKEEWREKGLDERLAYSLVKGISDYLAEDVAEALARYGSPVAVIEGPLMRGMDRVGTLFGEGKMFLPQVVKSARTMKEAVSVLQPEMERSHGQDAGARRCKMVIATAKGDVHDIGKNIVHIVLACNNVDVVDLGVMVDNRRIMEAIATEKPDVVGISGLITPSLHEMEDLCDRMQREGLRVPLVVGGATTSLVHTAVKLAPRYSGGVVYGGDASRTVMIVKRLFKNPSEFLNEEKERQEAVRSQYGKAHRPMLSAAEARNRRSVFTKESFVQSDAFGRRDLLVKRVPIEPLIDFVDWTPFFHFWGLKGKFPEVAVANAEAKRLHQTAQETLSRMAQEQDVEVSVGLRFFPAYAEDDKIQFDSGDTMTVGRQREDIPVCHSLADFVSPDAASPSRVGVFCVKVADGRHFDDHKDFDYLIRQSLCARLAEAAAAWMQEQVANGLRVIRPAFGYPCCPDHALKRVAFRMLKAEEEIGVSLTESNAIIPDTSICGLLIAHPEARLF